MSESPAAVNLFGMAVIAAPLVPVVFLGVASIVGRRLSERTTAQVIGTATVFGFLATLALFGFMLAQDTRHVVVDCGGWVRVHNPAPEPDYHFAVKFLFDRLSIPFVALTFVLCGTIGAFAQRYMHREPGYNRFFTLYSLFFLGMVLAGLAGTIETLFLGWELVGLSSVLLVGFFHTRPSPARNALRVWVVYRVSDAALLAAAVFLHHMSGEGDLDQLTGYADAGNSALSSWPFGVSTVTPGQAAVVGGLLVVAAAGKSALIPFCGWLPRAMEGPTPSSAVFYGALSVHLGAYLLLRAGPLLDASPPLGVALVALGAATAAYSALVGRVQTDIKSALSFASLTQVGLIVAEIGLGWRYVPLVHLLGNACLRTLQFVRAPSAIRDHATIENALGHRVPRAAGGPWGNRLYRFALERGHLDAALDRWAVAPFVRLFTALDRLERRVADAVNRTAAPGTLPPKGDPSP